MPDQRRGFLLGVAAYGMWGSSRCTGRCSSRPARSRSWPTGSCGRWSRWACSCVAAAAYAAVRALLAAPATRRSAARVAAVVITVNWGDLHLGRQQRPRGRDVARLLHQPAGDRADGRVHPRRAAAARCSGRRSGVAAPRSWCSTVDYGRPPWVALVLAFSFGSYGLAKKQANVGAVESLDLRDRVWSRRRGGVPRAGWWQGQSELRRRTACGHALLLATTGIVTAMPLICFGAAATRVPMVTLGPAAVPRADAAVRRSAC